jgi:ubiquinone/menaquinone biosynthesis C-methylase UbiE
VNSRRQFGPRAAEYATSTVHSRGADRAIAPLELSSLAVALDVGTGAGHTAHALARRAGFVFASDITPEMLAQTRRLAGEQSLSNVQAIYSLAESLPFATGSLDALTCRLAAHHFRDIAAFCQEVTRVLKTGGQALLIDVCVPEDPEAAAYINDIELHRDHSHIEDYSAARWRSLIEAAHLHAADLQVRNHDLAEEELSEWTRRSGTGAEDIEYIRGRFAAAPRSVREAMSLRAVDGTFRWLWPVMTLIARKP